MPRPKKAHFLEKIHVNLTINDYFLFFLFFLFYHLITFDTPRFNKSLTSLRLTFSCCCCPVQLEDRSLSPAGIDTRGAAVIPHQLVAACEVEVRQFLSFGPHVVSTCLRSSTIISCLIYSSCCTYHFSQFISSQRKF